MQEINNIEVINSLKNSVKTVPGFFYENGLVATVWIRPIVITDFVDDINQAKYLKINKVLWRIEKYNVIDSSDFLPLGTPGCFYEFTLVKCSD
jgi:hypothetical protein